jgi:hypothetical protein
MRGNLVSNLLGLLGAILGGVVGFYTFGWILGQGFYGPMIPGALLGGGCGLLARHSSRARGILCGVAALLLGLFAEWRYRPFSVDESLSYFLGHLTSLTLLTWIMIIAGALIGAWLGKDAGLGRSSRAQEGKPPASS